MLKLKEAVHRPHVHQGLLERINRHCRFQTLYLLVMARLGVDSGNYHGYAGPQAPHLTQVEETMGMGLCGGHLSLQWES